MSELALGRYPSVASSLKSTTLVVAGLVSAAALAPLILGALNAGGISTPLSTWLPGALALVAGAAVLGWTHEVFSTMAGRTQRSPGVAVTTWLVPVGNLWLPALALREAWRATEARGGAVVWVWMAAWWVAGATMIAGALGLEFVPAGDTVTHAWLMDSRIAVFPIAADAVRGAFEASVLIAQLVAGGLLAHIVHTIGTASLSPDRGLASPSPTR
ncbi:MAG: DUF4328 domain-containing protein [Myxococcota bacterium]